MRIGIREFTINPYKFLDSLPLEVTKRGKIVFYVMGVGEAPPKGTHGKPSKKESKVVLKNPKNKRVFSKLLGKYVETGGD